MNKILLLLLIACSPVFALAAEPIAVAEEIRHLLVRFNPGKAALIRNVQLNTSSIDADLKRIDQYARWFPADHAIQRRHQAGIGAELWKKEGQWWLAPWQSGALFDQGIRERVRLLAVEGQPVSLLDREQLARRLLGPIATVVCLTLQIQEKKRELCVLRKTLRKPSVEIIGKHTLRIRDFRSHETRIGLQLAITERAMKNHPLTIDLRDSQGGDLYEAFDSASLFLAANQPLAELRKTTGQIVKVTVPASLPQFKMPLTLLVGTYTASAAEIFAGILQAANRAVLKGERTYGKCVSQTEYYLSDQSRLRLTNLQVYFANGDSCQGKGLTVDFPGKAKP